MEQKSKNDIAFYETKQIDDNRDDTEANKNVRIQKKKKNPCRPNRWTYEDSPLWKISFNSYIERKKKFDCEDEFNERVPAVLQHLPDLESTEEIYPPYQCLPFNAFNLKKSIELHNQTGIWKKMETNPEVDMSSFRQDVIQKVESTQNMKWPSVWPCIDHNIVENIQQAEILRKRKLKGLLPCQDYSDSEEPYGDFADRKELGYARIPKFSVSLKKLLLVERSCGENSGFVDGDYITFELTSDNPKEKNVYAVVCLRGMKGMHLIELHSTRARKKSWKFCFYQALVALLAKTQLRYKYTSSINIDYIYDHAWNLFIHMGSINVKNKQRFDDFVVYNYKYNVELELVQELKDVSNIAQTDWKYFEKNLKMIRQFRRPELMKVNDELGWEKFKQSNDSPVHESMVEIEKWFDKLSENYRNCIFRTSRFSIAFWNDGRFWYLYNPYRCDQYGFWSDDGYACILKFCTRTTLRRHLMILLLRAYSYRDPEPLAIDKSIQKDSGDPKNKNNIGTIQIFQMIYHCAKIHNIKLLERKPPKQHLEATKNESKDYKLDLSSFHKPVIECDEMTNITSIENSNWLKDMKITWIRHSISKKLNAKDGMQMTGKLRWHQYYVEEIGKLFSLWSEMHPTGEIFTRENRGKQIHACYIVCAGMTRIMAPEYWNAKTLDAIVMCGDRYYTLSRLQSETMTSKNVIENSSMWNRNLMRHFNIGEILFEVNIHAPIYGRLYSKDSLWKIVEQMFLEKSSGILTCENACLCVFKFCGSYYMLDVNSIGPPIFDYGDGVAYLLRATSFLQFMMTLMLTIGSIECSSFSLHPIDIVKIIDTGNSQGKFQVKQKNIENASDPSEKDRRKKSRKLKLRNKNIDRTICKSTAAVD